MEIKTKKACCSLSEIMWMKERNQVEERNKSTKAKRDKQDG